MDVYRYMQIIMPHGEHLIAYTPDYVRSRFAYDHIHKLSMMGGV